MCFYGFWCSSSWLSLQSSNVGETQSAQKFRIVSFTEFLPYKKGPVCETKKASYEFGQPMKRGFEGPDSNGNADLLVRPKDEYGL